MNSYKIFGALLAFAFGMASFTAVADVYVDCLYLGESDGSIEKPFPTLQSGCEAAVSGDRVLVRGGSDRTYMLKSCLDSARLSLPSVSLCGCDENWKPATDYTVAESMAIIAISNNYADVSYAKSGSSTTWAAPIVIAAANCTVSGFRTEFDVDSYKKRNCGGSGLISINAGVSGTLIENCSFRMLGDVGADDSVGIDGVVSCPRVNSNTAPQVRNTVIRRCYFRMAKYMASVCLFRNLQSGTRFEENFVENLDTLYAGTNQNVSTIDLSVISNIFLNCANASSTTNGWLFNSLGNGAPGAGEIAYNRFIHDDGTESHYALFQHSAQYRGCWKGETLIHHNTIVGYDVVFDSPLCNGATGTMWQPQIFDNLIVNAGAVFSESATEKWKTNAVDYVSSFLPGSIFKKNAVRCTKFVTGSATAQSWYNIDANLEGRSTTKNLTAVPKFKNTDDPTSKEYYRLRVSDEPWVTDAYVGTDPALPYPKYIGALPPQPNGFAVRMR